MNELDNKTGDSLEAGSLNIGEATPDINQTALATAVTDTTETLIAPDAPVALTSPIPGVEASIPTSGQLVSFPTTKFPPSLSSKARFVLSQHGTAFAVVLLGGNVLALRIGSKQANNLIRAAALERGINLTDKDLKEINETITAQVEMAGLVDKVFYRVAPIEGGIEIDMGDDKNTRICITAGNVDIVTQGSKTLFHRTQVMAPFVMPAENGDVWRIKKYLNAPATDQLLCIGWLSYTLAHPKVPTSKFPILVINGDQGSGKTSLCNNVIYPLTDPNVIGVQVFPSSAKDLAIASQHAHVLCYDNMRGFKVTMADNLCMAATGGAISNRALYTDGDLSVQYLHVALVLNGIHHFINQPDLAQRCVPINTLTLTEDKRQSEGTMLKSLQVDMPVIFRGLLDLIADIFRHLPEAEITHPERMLDFVHWLAAMEKADGIPAGLYQQAYSESLHQAQLDSLMESLLASTLVQFCDGIRGHKWSGTPGDLLVELNRKVSSGTTYSRDWPQNPIALSKRLNGLKASLLTQGIGIEFGRGKERTITIRKVGGSQNA